MFQGSKYAQQLLDMRLTERCCSGCNSRFDLTKDKWFLKPKNFLQKLFGKTKYFCQSCWRDYHINKVI